MFDVLHANHPERDEAIAFVSQVFHDAYHANVQHFLPNMMRVRDKHAQYKSIMGYRDASTEKLYLEYYLDDPIETCISRYVGHPVERSKIVEVGNLAEASPGDARLAITAATAFLHTAGYHWVVFTGVRRVRNTFLRLGLAPKELIEADERRLPEGHIEQWGSYYQGDPVVCFGSLEEGHHNLQELWDNMRETWTSAKKIGEREALSLIRSR